MLQRPPHLRPAGLLAAGLLMAAGLVACSGPVKPAASRAPLPGDTAPAPPSNTFQSGVRAMTGTIPRARDAAADANQRTAENAAAANGIQ